MADLVVLHASALIPSWDSTPLGDGWLAVGDGRVIAMGSGEAPRGVLELDARGCLVLPGLVCAHHHLFQGASRGIETPGGLGDWLFLHYQAWATMTAEDVAAAARLSLAQLALGGCTAVATFEYLHPPGEDFVSPVLEAAADVGLRLLYVRGCAPRLESIVADRLARSGADLTRLIEPEERALANTRAALSRPTSDRLRWGCGPTTPLFDDGGEFQRELTRIADEHGAPIHTHFHPLAGTKADGETAVGFARRIGLLRRGNWFAHGSRLANADVAGLGEAGVGIVHCPSCSTVLGYPIPDLTAWRAANDRVCVAVDGAASNDRGSMLAESQLAWLLQRARGSGDPPSPAAILEMVTTSPARAIGWPELGSLEVGHPADFAVLDLSEVGMAGAVNAPGQALHRFFRTYDGHLVRDLVVGGEVVVADGHLVGTDVGAIVHAANAATARLYPGLR